MDFADKSQLGEYLQSAIDSYQANVRMLLVHLFVDCSRGEVFVAEGNYTQHRTALSGELVSMFLKQGCYILLGKSHSGS